MPTGYTQPLYESKDISFEEFMLRCSRAMMPAILLRDHDNDVLPTEDNVVEGNYYAEKLVEAQLEYVRTCDQTPEEIAAEHQAELEQTLARNAEMAAEREALLERYEAMLVRVDAWEPPTADHVPLKKFVIEQLQQSIDFDTRPFEMPVETLTDAAWQAKRMERIGAEIDRAKAEIDKSAERNLYRTRWVKALRESLEGVPA